jgi:hypothetical protein
MYGIVLVQMFVRVVVEVNLFKTHPFNIFSNKKQHPTQHFGMFFSLSHLFSYNSLYRLQLPNRASIDDSKPLEITTPTSVRKDQNISKLIDLNDGMKLKKTVYDLYGPCAKCGEDECPKFVWAVIKGECVICGCAADLHQPRPESLAEAIRPVPEHLMKTHVSTSAPAFSEMKERRGSRKEIERKQRKQKRDIEKKSSLFISEPMKVQKMDSERVLLSQNDEMKEKCADFNHLRECLECGEEECPKFVWSVLSPLEKCIICGCPPQSHNFYQNFDPTSVKTIEPSSPLTDSPLIISKAFYTADLSTCFSICISTSYLCSLFQKHLKLHKSEHHLSAFQEMQKFTELIEESNHEKNEHLAMKIYYKYVAAGSSFEIDFPDTIITKFLQRLKDKEVTSTLFDECLCSLKEGLLRFFSPFYRNLISQRPPVKGLIELTEDQLTNRLSQIPVDVDVSVDIPTKSLQDDTSVCVCCNIAMNDLVLCEVCFRNICGRCLIRRKCHICSGRDRCPIVVSLE